MSPVIDKLRNLKQRLVSKPATPIPLPFPDTISIETSYACNLKCFMCPRHFDESLQGMFPIELFREKVYPILPRFKHIHLTGWGEPLMNKHFTEMLEMCKKAGVWTCFTTNGLLLKEPLSRKILELGVDTINISCDASTPETYEHVRGKGTFDVLMKRMEEVNALRKEIGANTRLEWAFVMMKNNLHELPNAARFAAQFEFDRLHAKHMETAINREDLCNALWNTGLVDDVDAEWQGKLVSTLEETREILRDSPTQLLIHPQKFVREGCQCLARPTHQIFVDYKGYVSSCCYMNKLDVMPYVAPENKPADDGVMGNLNDTDFMDILNSPRHEAYRRQWFEGQVPEACRSCLNVNRMNTSSGANPGLVNEAIV